MMKRLLLAGFLASGAILSCVAAYAEESPESGADRVSRVDTTGRPLGELHRFNFQTSPVALMAHRWNASAEAGVGQHFSLGLKGTYFSQPVISAWLNTTTGYELGGRATWYATSERFTDGLIFRGGVYYKNTQTRHDLEDALGDVFVRMFTLGLASNDGVTVDVVDGPAFELMGGYQLVLASGINFDWNVGLTTYQQYSKVVNLTNGSEKVYEPKAWIVHAVFEFNVGYSF